MEWTFPPNLGQESGLHDAGVETFKGKVDWYLAREIIQNSLDARDKTNKPVVVTFELEEVPAKDIPEIKALSAAFSRCIDYWSEDSKTRTFFQKALDMSKKKTIPVLRIGDYNTRGVCGKDNDRKNDWYGLVRCSGASAKSAGKGGSFGIGKNAPFATSAMLTVFYSTLNQDGEYVFQGVAKLVTHMRPDNQLANAVGYLGDKGGHTLRRKQEIPKLVLRKKQGTDICILGYKVDASWQDDLVRSVLENSWPAIHAGDLEVVVQGTKITRKTLPDLLEEFSHRQDFKAHQYYQAFIKPTKKHSDTLPNLKRVSLHLLTGDSDMERKVAMVRKTGMVIYKKRFHTVTPFCGVFLCQNERGNELLREMEPPRHDDWDADHPEKGENKHIEGEFTTYIRDRVRELSPVDEAKTTSIPDLSRFLPDDEESAAEPLPGDDGSPAESFGKKPVARTIPGTKIDSNKKRMQPGNEKPDNGDTDTEVAGPEGGTGGAQSNNGHGGNGSPGSGGGKGSGPATGAKGGNGGINSKPSVPVRFRTFAKDPVAGVYTVCVQPTAPCQKEVNLLVHIVGDDANKEPAEIGHAKLADGTEVSIPERGVVGPVKLPSKQPLHIEIALQEGYGVAMEVSAHEA